MKVTEFHMAINDALCILWFFFDSSPMIAHSFQTRLINIVKPSQDVTSSLWQFIFYVPSFFNTSAADWKKIGKLTRKIWQVFIFCSIVNLDLICVRLCEKIQNRKWNFFVLSQIHTFVFVFPTNKKIPFNQNLVKVHFYYAQKATIRARKKHKSLIAF